MNQTSDPFQENAVGFQLVRQNKPFFYLLGTQVLTQVSVAFLNFALLLWVFDLTKSNSAVSLVVFTVFASSVLFSVLAGVVADQVSRRQIMLVSNILRILIVSLFLVVPDRLWWIILLSFLLNSVFQFFIPAVGAMIPRLVAKKELLTANSLFAFSMYISLIGGFVLAGPVVDLFGFQAVFVFSAVLTLLATVFVIHLPACVPRHKESWFSFDLRILTSQTVNQIREGLSFIMGSTYVISALLIAAGLNGLVGLASSLAPGFVVDVLQVPVASASYVIMAPLGTGLLAGALLVGKFGSHFSKRELISYGMIIGGILLFLMGLLPLLSTLSTYKILTVARLPRPAEQIVNLSGIVSALSFFLGLVAVLVVIPSQTILQQHTPDEIRGRVFGVYGVLVYGAGSLPTLVGARLADWVGVTSIIVFIGLVISIVGILIQNKRVAGRLIQ